MCSKEAIETEQAGTPASWLQECCISLSPSNDTLAIAKNDKAVFLASKLQVKPKQNYYRIYSTISRAIFTQIKTEVN